MLILMLMPMLMPMFLLMSVLMFTRTFILMLTRMLVHMLLFRRVVLMSLQMLDYNWFACAYALQLLMLLLNLMIVLMFILQFLLLPMRTRISLLLPMLTVNVEDVFANLPQVVDFQLLFEIPSRPSL